MNKLMKTSKKALVIIMFFIIILYMFSNCFVNAFDTSFWDPSKGNKIGDDSKLVQIGNKIIGPIQVAGSLVSVATIIIIGIKYMLGSVEEKAEYKQTLVPYFFGAIMVFGITNLLNVIYNIAQSI